jgi:hypothetical protein
MPSADFCHPFPSPLDHGSSRQADRSPRVLALTFTFMPAAYTCLLPYRYRTLKICAFSSSLHASYAVSIRRASACLRLPSDSTSQWTPLPSG